MRCEMGWDIQLPWWQLERCFRLFFQCEVAHGEWPYHVAGWVTTTHTTITFTQAHIYTCSTAPPSLCTPIHPPTLLSFTQTHTTHTHTHIHSAKRTAAVVCRRCSPRTYKMEQHDKPLFVHPSSSHHPHNSEKAIHLALAIWGFSSWILFNGIWGQLPLYIRSLPEGNKLGVLILAAEQLAYVFPLFFMYKKRHYENSRRSQEIDIWILLVGGLMVSVLLPQYWDIQAPVGGVKHSVGLLLLAFFTGAVCSSTGVVFTPYLATLPKSYTSAHTAGAGLSGLAVALLTLVADVGSLHPRISVGRYFNVLSVVFVCSMVSFYYVRQTVHASGGYEELGPSSSSSISSSLAATEAGARPSTNTTSSSSTSYRYGAIHEEEGPHISRVGDAEHISRVGDAEQDKKSHKAVFALQCLLSALAYGIVPSVLPLACTGYANPSRVLMLATVGFMCADPLGKLATSFLPTGRIYLSGLCTISIAAVLLLCAVQSPTPPFNQLPWGGLLPIVANTLFSLAFSFTSISIFFDRRRNEEATNKSASGDESQGAFEWFAWSAFMIQTGALLGTGLSLLAMFVWT